MDWELNGDSQNIIDGDFTGTQSCEAFVFNPQTAKCTLLSGLAELNLRESTRYYSGYLECPEPEATFNSSIFQPPAGVSVLKDCNSEPANFLVNWTDVLGASGYLINCIPHDDTGSLLPVSARETGTPATISSAADNYVANTTYTCYVSSYTYNAVSKGSSSDAFITC